MRAATEVSHRSLPMHEAAGTTAVRRQARRRPSERSRWQAPALRLAAAATTAAATAGPRTRECRGAQGNRDRDGMRRAPPIDHRTMVERPEVPLQGSDRRWRR